MPNLIDINTDEAEKKLSFFRRYYYEIGFIVMSIVISYLFVGQKQLERDMRNYLLTDRTAALQKVEVNTEVVKQNTEVMNAVKNAFVEFHKILKEIQEDNEERNLRNRR